MIRAGSLRWALFAFSAGCFIRFTLFARHSIATLALGAASGALWRWLEWRSIRGLDGPERP